MHVRVRHSLCVHARACMFLRPLTFDLWPTCSPIRQIYIPAACQTDSPTFDTEPCKLLFTLGVDDDFARYGESNGIVIVALGIGGYVDTERFPNACEVQRGLSDVYGQLSEDYTWQNGFQMRVGGRILRRLLGLPENEPWHD